MQRPRILRKSASIRALTAENYLSVNDLIEPYFIVEGTNVEEEILSLPGQFRRSLDRTMMALQASIDLGIKAILLFVKVPDNLKDNSGTEALNEDGLMQQSIRKIKSEFPELIIFSDVALDPYSSYGHDGIIENNKVLNDATVEVLSEMAISHAAAGVDFVAPSDMMDGRVGAIRKALETHGYSDTGIMSYAAKYASSFYGPFRDALDSAPGFGDKKSYQMNPVNRIAAKREVLLDIDEGADIVMVKPATLYLDIIREVKNIVHVPVSAYHVSGEYAMIKAAAQKGWLNEADAVMESINSIKRAGADLIATYFAKDIATILNKN